jgi:hypothetical protein
MTGNLLFSSQFVNGKDSRPLYALNRLRRNARERASVPADTAPVSLQSKTPFSAPTPFSALRTGLLVMSVLATTIGRD